MRKIAVLGLGPSIKSYIPQYDFTIGVNDIWQYVETDAIVCLDPPRGFTKDRLIVIENSHPQVFYSQIVNWDTRKDFIKIELSQQYPNPECNLELPYFWKSYCSPFVAVQIAYRFHYATEIHLFGVDMVDHPHLNGNLCEKIKNHFIGLKTSLSKNGCNLIIHGEGILKDI